MLAEFRRIFRRDSKIALVLFGLPVFYSILFGCVYSSAVVKAIPTVVYDQDQTSASRSLIQAYADSERYLLVAEVGSQEEMEQYLQANKALAAVSIPPDFSRKIRLGLASEVLIETNAANLLFANTVITTSQEIVQTFSVGAGQKIVEALNQMPAEALRSVAPVRIALRIVNNPTLSYSNFVLPGMIANGVQLALMMVLGSVFIRLYPSLASWRGVSSARIVAGKLLPYWLCGLLAYILSIAVIVLLFHVPLKGGIISLLVIGAAFSLAVVGVGGFVSAIAPNEIMALQLPMLYIMPAFLFSGYSWPQLAMNGFSRAYSAILPLTYAADTMRDILLAGSAPQLWRDAAILAAFGAVLIAGTIAVFEWRRGRPAGAEKGGEVQL